MWSARGVAVKLLWSRTKLNDVNVKYKVSAYDVAVKFLWSASEAVVKYMWKLSEATVKYMKSDYDDALSLLWNDGTQLWLLRDVK